jgi:ATP-dependent Clp endopeptidase proteolytic subunit ClpP
MKWYEIKSKADKAEIWLYELIGLDFWTGDGITAKSFQKELSEIKASAIDLHINSPGGDVFDGIAIYNLLKQHPAKITTYIDGFAGSISSVIALAGNPVYMAENAKYIIHNPSGVTMGTAVDHRKTADILDGIRDSMTKTYTSKTGKSADEINALLDAESWLSAEQALEIGFIDEITGKIDLTACVKFIPAMVKAGFKNIPRNIDAKREPPSGKETERALREVGWSRSQAKAIMAKGFSSDLREVDAPPDPRNVQAPPREVEQPKPAKKDRVNDLLIRAEKAAPSPA